jgi:AAT family amino acid transporter
VVVALNPDLRASLYVGVPMLILPMIWHAIWGKNLKPMSRENDRKNFEDIFQA